jgi:hypothetical protein
VQRILIWFETTSRPYASGVLPEQVDALTSLLERLAPPNIPEGITIENLVPLKLTEAAEPEVMLTPLLPEFENDGRD